MRDSVYHISLDVYHQSTQVQIVAKKDDSARRICMTLTEHGKPFLFDVTRASAALHIHGDDTDIIADCDIYSDGTIIYDFTAATVANVETLRCELTFCLDNAVFATPNFSICVQRTVNQFSQTITPQLEAAVDQTASDWADANVYPALAALQAELDYAVTHQLMTVTDDLSNTDPSAAPQAKVVGDLFYDRKDKTKNTPRVLTWFSDVEHLTSLLDMPAWSMLSASGAQIKALVGEEFPKYDKIDDITTYVVEKIAVGNRQGAFMYSISSMSQRWKWCGYSNTATPNTVNWDVIVQPTDTTLTTSGAAADAKKTGDLFYGSQDHENKYPQVQSYFAGTFSDFYDLPNNAWKAVQGSVIKAVTDHPFPFGSELNDDVYYIVTRQYNHSSASTCIFTVTSWNGTQRYRGTAAANEGAITWYYESLTQYCAFAPIAGTMKYYVENVGNNISFQYKFTSEGAIFDQRQGLITFCGNATGTVTCGISPYVSDPYSRYLLLIYSPATGLKLRFTPTVYPVTMEWNYADGSRAAGDLLLGIFDFREMKMALTNGTYAQVQNPADL